MYFKICFRTKIWYKTLCETSHRCRNSVDHMFPLYFLFVVLVISRFSFKGSILVLIASVPGLCILFTFGSRFKLNANSDYIIIRFLFYWHKIVL